MGRLRLVIPVVVGLIACAVLAPQARADSTPSSGAAPRPDSCAKGDRPETALQGEVTKADRESGRSTLGYNCNLSLVGQFQGHGAGWVDPSYGHCAYTSSADYGPLLADGGVHVIDVSDPAHPKQTAVLRSPAMQADTWESLKVNPQRGLLAGVAVGTFFGAAFFDIYDIKADCAHPRLLNSVPGTELTLPANVIGHEGAWSPDGKTYWASGVLAGSLTAIDVSDPSHPTVAWTGTAGGSGNHGFSVSADGNRLYLAAGLPAGFVVLDTSQVQARKALPTVSQLGAATWTDGDFSQHTVPITYHGHPWVIAVDEMGLGSVHFVDVTDETNPVVHPGVRLEIQMPQYSQLRTDEGAGNGVFNYDAHYCEVDRPDEPTALACGYFNSGVRVFDIRDLAHPKEIAYFNPPAQTGKDAQLGNSEHPELGAIPTISDIPDVGVNTVTTLAQVVVAGNQGTGFTSNLSADYCSSPPRFVGTQLWVTCQDNGFLALSFAKGTYPLSRAAATTTVTSTKATKRPAARSPTKRPANGTVVAPTHALAATGTPGWLLPSAAVLLLSGLALARWRRGRRDGTIALGLLVVAVGFGGPLLHGPPARPVSSAASDDVAFADGMIVHHEQALELAHIAEARSATPLTRAYAEQVVAEQGQEIGWLDALLGTHGERPSAHAAGNHAMLLPAAEITELRNAPTVRVDALFYQLMQAHHLAGLPMMQAAIDGPSSVAAKGLAKNMLLQQTLEVGWLNRALRAPART